MNCKTVTASILLLAVTLASSSGSTAEVPGVIVHEGYVTDKSGVPVSGPVQMSFGIYKSLSDTDLVWEETLGDVTVTDGFYTVEIGKVQPFDTAFFDNGELYLELRMKGKALTPRQRIGSVPYSLVSQDATGDIHPHSVSVGGNTVIDYTGKWVGDTAGLAGVTSVTASAPLTGGTITGTGTIGIPKATSSADGYLAGADFTTFAGKQDRVSGTCSLGYCAVAVNVNGTLVCEPCGGAGSGTVTSVATGPGLTGGPIVASGTVSLDTTYLDGSTYDARFVNEGQSLSVSTAMLQDNAVTSAKIADGTISLADLAANACGANQVMKRNAGNTAWECANDDAGVYTNGTGLSLSGNQFSLAASYQDGSAYDARFVNEGQIDSVSAAMVAFNYAGSSSEGGSATTALALAANGANCTSGNAPLGVDAAGAAEGCFDVATQTELDTHGNLTTAHSATNLNTASRIVMRDASGNFSAGTLTASLSGNASTATALSANGTNCPAGQYARGVDASGTAEGCTAVASAYNPYIDIRYVGTAGSALCHSVSAWSVTNGTNSKVSSDAGLTWSNATTDVANTTNSAKCAADATRAIAWGATGPVVAYTTNSGVDWTVGVHPDLTTSITDISYITPTLAVATADKSTAPRSIFYSNNGGANWIMCSTGPTADTSRVSMFDNQTGFAVDVNSRIWKTTDGGVNWTDTTHDATGNWNVSTTDSDGSVVAVAPTMLAYVSASQRTFLYDNTTGVSTAKSDILDVSSSSGTLTNIVKTASGTLYFAVLEWSVDSSSRRVFSAKLYKSTNSGTSWSIRALPGQSRAAAPGFAKTGLDECGSNKLALYAANWTIYLIDESM